MGEIEDRIVKHGKIDKDALLSVLLERGIQALALGIALVIGLGFGVVVALKLAMICYGGIPFVIM